MIGEVDYLDLKTQQTMRQIDQGVKRHLSVKSPESHKLRLAQAATQKTLS